PDILTLAKAITAGFAPMGATLTSAAIADSMLQVGVYSTYGWHPRSTAAALANLDWWRENGETLLAHVGAISRLFVERLGRSDSGGSRAQASRWGSKRGTRRKRSGSGR